MQQQTAFESPHSLHVWNRLSNWSCAIARTATELRISLSGRLSDVAVSDKSDQLQEWWYDECLSYADQVACKCYGHSISCWSTRNSCTTEHEKMAPDLR